MQEIQTETTSTEFVEWCVFYDEHWQDLEDLYFYLAQIAFYVCAVNADKKWNGKLEDFYRNSKPQQAELTEEQKKQHMENSKATWVGAIKGIWENRHNIKNKK